MLVSQSAPLGLAHHLEIIAHGASLTHVGQLVTGHPLLRPNVPTVGLTQRHPKPPGPHPLIDHQSGPLRRYEVA